MIGLCSHRILNRRTTFSSLPKSRTPTDMSLRKTQNDAKPLTTVIPDSVKHESCGRHDRGGKPPRVLRFQNQHDSYTLFWIREYIPRSLRALTLNYLMVAPKRKHTYPLIAERKFELCITSFLSRCIKIIFGLLVEQAY